MPVNNALHKYHGRRFILEGAFAVIKANGCFTQDMRQQVDQLYTETKRRNWLEYQFELWGDNVDLYKPQPKPRPNLYSIYEDQS